MHESWLDRNRHVIFIGLSTVAVIGAGIFFWQRPSQQTIELIPAEPVATATPPPAATPLPTPTPAPVRIYITGAVVNSDVFVLPPGSIIKDAITAAGGFASDADREGINLAQVLQDQQQIHVPHLGESDPPPPVRNGNPVTPIESPADNPAQTLININTATLDQLDALPGVGPAIAERIIEYRGTIGGFTSIDQIKAVSGIGEATFAKIQAHIAVE